ncbi:YgiQ family radical SAM protein [Alkalibacter sp. M17DMB]|nr:YgiQ family radical SAM protein [Alkalibacter mobilis]MBF7096185.1 YgiQ family radical SAM protein [Alkalibacter mobilis]
MNEFLPVSREDMKKRGWDQLDFIIISGDAYVDHPSFGTAVIGRVLESRGYKVGIIAQPDWEKKESFKILGRPKLGFLITSGNIDSMVNHYTTAKKKRKDDLYSPGGRSGHRPDRAVMVYSHKIKELYSDVPIILGGIEASLRRFSHFDYWSNKVRRSILLDAKADLIVYGMGEKQIVAIAEALESGLPVGEITFVPGTVYKTKDKTRPYKPLWLPHYDEVLKSKKTYAESFMIQYKNMDSIVGKILVEPYRDYYVVQNPPAEAISGIELDDIYSLPYVRDYHPMYQKAGGIPAIKEVKHSIISNRGCFGSCNFCALTFHQGRKVQSRSHDSIINEAKKITQDSEFKGYINDVGGPTANFRISACKKQEKHGVCPDKQCLFPKPCNQLIVDHSDYLGLLKKLRELPGIKKVFIRSGLRYDYLIYDKDDSFFRELCEHHISGQLKIAPEHVSPKVLEKMGKPGRNVYDRFVDKYKKINEDLGKNQFLVPYLMSSHPGSTLKEAIELAEYIRDTGYMPEQVQDFYPTPGTMSTCMFYTGLDPRTMEQVYVPVDPHEKAMQRALIQYRKPQNRKLVLEALRKEGRTDLIGFSNKALIRPGSDEGSRSKEEKGKRNPKSQSWKKKSEKTGKSGKSGKRRK